MSTQLLIPYVLAIIVNNKNQVLLGYRKNSEWFNNYYGLMGGKIENEESGKMALIRELDEELGVIVNFDQIHFAHVMHFMGEIQPCVAFFYIINIDKEPLVNKERNKIDHLKWFAIDKLPSNLIPRHKKGLQYVFKKIVYSEENWPLIN